MACNGGHPSNNLSLVHYQYEADLLVKSSLSHAFSFLPAEDAVRDASLLPQQLFISTDEDGVCDLSATSLMLPNQPLKLKTLNN